MNLRAHLGRPGDDGHYWCGPAAVAWILGAPYREAFALVEQAAQRRIRETTYFPELVRALELAGDVRPGVKPEQCALMPRRALRCYVRDHDTRRALVRVGGHFLALLDGYGYDNRRARFEPLDTRWVVSHALTIRGR
jgi:hypothetical protein